MMTGARHPAPATPTTFPMPATIMRAPCRQHRRETIISAAFCHLETEGHPNSTETWFRTSDDADASGSEEDVVKNCNGTECRYHVIHVTASNDLSFLLKCSPCPHRLLNKALTDARRSSSQLAATQRQTRKGCVRMKFDLLLQSLEFTISIPLPLLVLVTDSEHFHAVELCRLVYH